MFKNRYVVIIIIAISSALALIYFNRPRYETDGKTIKEINPYAGDIRLVVTTTGVIKPQNRLEIKPSINGRVEELLVREGDRVKKGDILAYMSSTERAALVDAARFKGDEARQYWEEVYKQTPIVSPIDGEIIVRSVEPGQSAAANDAILVLSDRLIVNAQFDETDIGRVKIGQDAVITLDAYPNMKVKGTVDHIAYESKLVNNVNIYDVDILPMEIPEFFRSGMSANVEVVEKEKKNVLLIPVEAITKEQGRTYVMVKNGHINKIEKREVDIGISDERDAEVISGLSTEDIIILNGQVYLLQKRQMGTNPLIPSHGRKK